MAYISEYQRQNLKSSVVGTAGADYSTGQALDSVAQNTKQMASATFDLAVKRKQAMDANLENEYALKATSEEEAAFNQFNQDQRSFIGTPAERTAMYDKFSAERSKARLSTVKNNPQVLQRASEYESSIRLRNSQRQFQTASNNQVELAVGSMINFQKQAETEAARIGADASLSFDEKRKQVDWILGNVDASVKATSMVLSPAKAAELQAQKPAAVLTAMAMGMLSKDPAQLNLFLNEKDKDGQTAFEKAGMPADEIEKMRALAHQGIKAFDIRQQREEYAANSKQISDIDRHILEGNDVEAYAMIHNLPAGKLKQDMLTNVMQRHLPANDEADRIYELNQEYEDLYADMTLHTSAADKKKGITKINAPLERLLKFQEKVAEANALRYLSPEEYRKFSTTFTPAMRAKALGLGKATAEGGQFLLSGFVGGDPRGLTPALDTSEAPMSAGAGIGAATIVNTWRAVKGIYKDDRKAAVNVHQDFLNRLGRGKDTSDEAVSKALREALTYHANERFPAMLGLSGTPNAVLSRDKDLVATGVKGQTGMPVSGKVSGFTKVSNPDANGVRWVVEFNANKEEVSRKVFNG